jgi:hypothetical protein
MVRTAPSYRSARHYGSFMLVQIMALSYAVIAPLVLPAAAGFFFTAWVSLGLQKLAVGSIEFAWQVGQRIAGFCRPTNGCRPQPTERFRLPASPQPPFPPSH